MGGCNKNVMQINEELHWAVTEGLTESTFRVTERKHNFLVKLESNLGDRATSDALQEAHMTHLRSLTSEGRLIACAAFSSGIGGIQVISASDWAEAWNIATSDPMVAEGFFTKITVDELLNP